MLRFWKAVLALCSGFALASMALVIVARLPNAYVCLRVMTNDLPDGRYHLMDTTTGRYQLDRRATDLEWNTTSPDGRYRVYLRQQGKEPYLFSLYAEPTDRHTPPALLRRGLVLTRGFQMDGLLSWSPDSQRVAYLWSTLDSSWLTLVKPDGSGEQTVAYNRAHGGAVRPENTFLSGWSADGQYLAVNENYGIGQGYSFWFTDHLRPAPFNAGGLQTIRGVWSPIGHDFAALLMHGIDLTSILILSPGKVPAVSPLPNRTPISSLIWSPDARYITLASLIPTCPDYSVCASTWRFILYNRLGARLVGPLNSVTLHSPDTQGMYYVINGSRTNGLTVPGIWYGGRWIFLHDLRTQINLSAYDPGTNRLDIITPDILPEFAGEVFYASPLQLYRRSNFDIQPLAATNRRILIPTRQGGKIRLDIADPDGESRLPLVEGADTILDTGDATFQVSSSRLWSLDGRSVVFAWSEEKSPRVTFVAATADGQHIYRLDDYVSVVNVQPVLRQNMDGYHWTDEWIGFVAGNRMSEDLLLMNLKDGRRYTLLQSVGAGTHWTITLNDHDEQVAIRSSPALTGNNIPNNLYVGSLGGPPPTLVSRISQGYSFWSPDGKQLAFFDVQENERAGPTLQITSLDGQPLHQWTFGQSRYITPWLNGWTKCD
jgi:hypothetical protein